MTKKIKEVFIRYESNCTYKNRQCLWFLINNLYLHKYDSYSQMITYLRSSSLTHTTTTEDHAQAGAHIVDHHLHKIFYDYEVEL